MDRILAENVTRLLAIVAKASDDELPTMLRLVQQRRRWVEEELSFERFLDPQPVPPFAELMDADPSPDAGESDSVARYLRLLSQLDDCISYLRLRIGEKNPGSLPSDR